MVHHNEGGPGCAMALCSWLYLCVHGIVDITMVGYGWVVPRVMGGVVFGGGVCWCGGVCWWCGVC